MPLDRRHAHRPGRAWTAPPSRSPTCWPTPTTARHDLQRVAGFRTTLGAPMLLDDEVVGALLVWRNEVNPFDEREKAIVSAFAVQAAMAMNGVKLVQQLESRSGELARKVEELEALREVGEAVSSSLDVDNVLSTIAKHAVELSGTDGGSIMEYAEQDRSFTVRSVYRTEPSVVEKLRTIRIDLDETLVGRAARQRRPLAVTDLDADRPRPAPGRPPRGRLAVGGRRADAARGADRRRARRTPQADGRLLRGDARPAGDLRQPVRARPAQRPALPRAEGAERRARAGQPPQVRVPGQHVPRAADAAQRGPGLLRGAPRADVRRHQRAAGGVPPRHPRVGQAPAGAAQRDPRPVQGRGRPDGARVLLVRPAPGAGGDRLDAARTSRRARHRPAGRGRGRRRLDLLRRAAAQAGPAQPGDERREVHRGRRLRGGPGGATRGRRSTSRSPTPGSASRTGTASGSSSPSSRAAGAARARRAPGSGSPCRAGSSSCSAVACGWRAEVGVGSTFGFSIPAQDRSTGEAGSTRRADASAGRGRRHRGRPALAGPDDRLPVRCRR